MSKTTIVHISDLHISNSNMVSVNEFLPALIKDINSNKEGEIALVVCSGDLVQSGTIANFELAFDKFVFPLLEKINLGESKFIYVPGNHEVDITKIDSDFSEGFTKRILENGVTNDDIKKTYVKDRLASFFNNISLFNEWSQDSLTNVKIFQVNGQNIAVVMVNSAWNSCGDSSREAKKIVIPRDEIIKSLSDINACDKKILVMHHPIDWFEDENASQIEQLMAQFDFVFTGHKHHEIHNAVLHMNGITIYNYASKVDIEKGENGYSLISYDDETSKVCIKSRIYNKNRLEYVPNTNISDIGVMEYQLVKKNTVKEKISNVLVNSKRNFVKSLDSLFITNLLDINNSKTFDELFIMPKIDSYSQLVKEKNDDVESIDSFDLMLVLKEKGNVTFWGRKENGKTIFANYIAKYIYERKEEFKAIPVVIDFKNLPTYKNAIEKAILSKLNDLLDAEYSISKSDIEKIATDGGFILILDNFENTDKQQAQLAKFSSSYPENKIICFRNERPGLFSDEDKASLIDSVQGESNNFYIRDMDKHSIRQLAKNMSVLNPNIEDSYVDKIIYSFSTNNMPRTPFAVSMILSICNETANYMPTNQARIVEAFLEKLLEKLNPEEIFTKTYNFSNKERFLAEFAYELYKKKSYFMSKSAFSLFVLNYHEKKGYLLKDSRFDTIFFEKGLLVDYNDTVFFRYECLNHYYLAKYCIFTEGFFEKNILLPSVYLNYVDVISYYSGLKADANALIKKLVEFAKPFMEKNKDVGDLLEIDSIKLELGIPDDEIKKVIQENGQMTTEEKDLLTDMPDNSKSYNPIKSRMEVNYTENDAFELTIDLLGNVIRTSEELLAEDKKVAFDFYLKGCVIVWQRLRESLLNFAKKVNEEIILRKKAEEGCEFDEIKSKLDESFALINDMIKLSVPLAMSGIIFNGVGSEKLKKVFSESYNSFDYKSPEKLLLLMLCCDLKMANWDVILSDYIKNSNKKDFLWIVFFKCQYYYQFNSLGEETKKIINPMADCYIKVNGQNKRLKSGIIGKIESGKKLIKN